MPDAAGEFETLLRRHLSGIFDVTPAQAARLYAHYELLLHWNRVLNLTRIEELETAVVRHYCESAFLAARIPAGAASVLEVGSGAGFPGIPLAVVRPDLAVTLSESHQRKAVFLREATRDLGNVSVAAGRATRIAAPHGAPKEARGPVCRGSLPARHDPRIGPPTFDWAVSRAVSWEEVVAVSARRFGLFLGSADAGRASSDRRIAWEAPLLLPWGNQRVLLIGRST